MIYARNKKRETRPTWLRLSPLVVAVAWLTSTATAQQVFQCKNSSGKIAFQDKPCNAIQGSQSSISTAPTDQNVLATTYQSEWQNEFNGALTQGNYEKAHRLATTSGQQDAVQATIKAQKEEKRQAKWERIARIQAMAARDPVTCSTNLGTTVCSNGKNYRQNGSFTYGSDGSSAQRVGNTTLNSNGTSFNHVGNQAYGSDGRICSTNGSVTTCTGGR